MILCWELPDVRPGAVVVLRMYPGVIAQCGKVLTEVPNWTRNLGATIMIRLIV